jgi:hypothetical protein
MNGYGSRAKEDGTDHAYQDVAYGSQPDRGVGGYLRGNDANHRSDNEGVTIPLQGYCSCSHEELYFPRLT